MSASSPFLMSLPRQLQLPAGRVPVKVRISPRARRLALRIDAQAEAIELVLPRRTSVPRALSFIEENRDWLEKRITALPPRTWLADGETVPILDQPYRIRLVPRTRDRKGVWIEGDELNVAAAPEQLPKRVVDFLKEMARGEFHARAARLAQSIERRIGRITVRDTTTRWGSCAANGNLAFSWRLIMAPEAVLNYVVAHEVAHLAEMNHGPRFWRLVEKLAPGAERQRQWLNRHRARLLRIG
jgi:predicted metal-dependent hydrolase